MENIVPFTEFDVKNIHLSKLRSLDNGGKVVSMLYKVPSGDSKLLILQTPQLTSPYGLSKWDNDGKGPAKYTLDLSFKGMETRELVQNFYQALTDFDGLLIENGLALSDEWFKKKYTSKDVVEALYTPVVRRSKDDKYPPTFKMTIPYDAATGEFTCKVYDKTTKQPVDLNSVNLKAAKVTAIAQCTGVWIAGGKFGSTWKAVQLLVEPTTKITGYSFRDIEGDAAEEVSSDNGKDHTKETSVVMNDADDDIIESSDDELETKPKRGSK